LSRFPALSREERRGGRSSAAPANRAGSGTPRRDRRAGRTYRIDRASTYRGGCSPRVLSDLGSISARRLPASRRIVGRIDLYRVTDIQWRGIRGGTELAITGSGTYRIGREGIPSHQLILDLEVGDRPIERYDSGIVAAESDFPRIDIYLHLHGGRCLDTAIGVRSQPLAVLISDRGGETAPHPLAGDPGGTATAP
jgi:hypothetical protein